MSPARSRTLSVALCMLAVSAPSRAHSGGNSALYREVSLLVGYSERDRWTGEATGSQRNSIGFEYLKRFSGDFGDFLTCDLQARLSYDSSAARYETWAIEIHNAWAEYKLGLGRNLRLGHFSPAFGLEPGVDTHGTMFQTLAGWDVGFKKDWGIAYRGIVGSFDCEIAAQLGSGMSIERRDRSYLATGRIASPQSSSLRWGMSLLSGRVLESESARTFPRPNIAAEAVSKRRIGADGVYLAGPFLFMGEVTAGRDGTNDVAGALLEINYTLPAFQAVTLKGQGRFWSDDPGESERNSSSVAIGVSYRLSPRWTLRACAFRDLARPGRVEDTRAFLQVYYYGG